MSRYPENYYDTEAGLPSSVNNVTSKSIIKNRIGVAGKDRYNVYHTDLTTNPTAGWADLSTVLTDCQTLINSTNGLIFKMADADISDDDKAYFVSVNQIAVNRLTRRIGFINELLKKFDAQVAQYAADTLNAPEAGRYPENQNELWNR